jgi:ketosteroid isomerase-like protein
MRKIGDDWKIIHDHLSLPADHGAEKPAYILREQ